MANRKRENLRTILIFIILGTIPCYLLGVIIWAFTPPTTDDADVAPPTATRENRSGLPTIANPDTELTLTPRASATNTPRSGLPTIDGSDPQPIQPTQNRIATAIPAANTPIPIIPTQTIPASNTPFISPPATVTPIVLPPTLTRTPQTPPTPTPTIQILLPPTDTPAP